MKLVHAANELKPAGRKVCLAIGMFDGVHLGHQQIIRQTIADARQQEAVALVVTFDRHPNAVVAPTRVPLLIYSPPQKLRTIESLGADALLLCAFDRAFSEQPGEAFIRGLARDLGQIQSLCVGADFTFGYKRGGNVSLLKKLGEELKYTVHGLAAVSLGGHPVSSTRIREAIRTGNLAAAGQMLSQPYSVASRVIGGDQLGRQLGFPTANLDVTGLALPPGGVYAAHATVIGQATHQAVVNIGVRPTVQQSVPHISLEVHLLDFTGDLFGEEIEVLFAGKLRDERKFATATELREQIARDVVLARGRF